VLGLAEVLGSKKNIDSKEQEELVAVIIRNAKRLKVLTENILDHARIESQSLNLHKEIFNIDEVILDALADVKSQLSSDQRINIQYDFSKELLSPIYVEADRYRLMQVISNLLNNAIKFIKIGTITINLEKKKEIYDNNDKKEVIISIKDSGPGVDPQIMPKLFTKFVTKSEIGGTGLGLFISKGIVEAHGGRIWAQNNIDGKGATFSFSLPVI
jgi:two-component system sensor histidine kinase VicK